MRIATPVTRSLVRNDRGTGNAPSPHQCAHWFAMTGGTNGPFVNGPYRPKVCHCEEPVRRLVTWQSVPVCVLVSSFLLLGDGGCGLPHQ